MMTIIHQSGVERKRPTPGLIGVRIATLRPFVVVGAERVGSADGEGGREEKPSASKAKDFSLSLEMTNNACRFDE
jgi:hypothetical protein